MRRRLTTVVLPILLLTGCVSPYTHMDQHDLEWYAADRYAIADEMPARDKNEGFKKAHVIGDVHQRSASMG